MSLQSTVFGRSVAGTCSQEKTGGGTYFFPSKYFPCLLLHPWFFLAGAGLRNVSSGFGGVIGYGPFLVSFLLSFFSASVVTCFLCLVHVSTGVAQAQSDSIARLFLPLTNFMKPYSPQ